MRAKELRERNDEELRRMLDDEKAQLFRFRLSNATHQLDDTSKIRKARREIARIETVLAERQRNAKPAATGEEAE